MQDKQSLHPDTESQIAALSLDPGNPVIICDADEVLFQFLIRFEMYLGDRGCKLELSYPASLHGTIFPLDRQDPLGDGDVARLLDDFYDRDVEAMQPMPGAREALSNLSSESQILILTNLPFIHRERRERTLKVHGMDYPLISNSGLKGVALERLLGNHRAPAFFVEDMSVHLLSAAAIPGLQCIQFIANRRLAKTAKRAEGIYQADSWHQLQCYIESHLQIHTGRTSATSGM